MSSDVSVRRSLRRLKPEKRTETLVPRNRSLLPLLSELKRPLPKLLLDTTVYIDELQGRLPQGVQVALRVTEIWHSTVTEAELMALPGLLDPAHPGTRQAVHQITASVERRPEHRILTPDREVWREAGILAGLLARLQHYGKADQRRVLNDALLFVSAEKQGCSVLTRNTSDFDLLMQLAPSGRAVFY